MVFSIQGNNGSYKSERDSLAQIMDLNHRDISYAKQVHSDDVSRIINSGFAGEYDGLITNIPNRILSIQVADCVPIFLYDVESHVIGLVHTGWRGTSKKIVRRAVKSMNDWFQSKPQNLEAYLGPSINACCYEVGEEVADLFSGNSVIKKGSDNYFLDLVLANKHQLLYSGIRSENIKEADECTCCSSTNFHSYRRDGKKAGRMICFFHLNNS
ncbi:MAG: peptidoglycan editing factor PgeF [Candidatus Marinimicrobia bacterium]|nr:peptidoglycan editing factor PgeF [Candidatus Neomarinimicrobiota bacterium]